MSEDLTQKLPSSQDGMLAQILTTVQNLSTRLESVEQKLGSLEQKVEERLYDTRPIWEKVQADIAGLQEGQRSLQEGQRILQEGQAALRGDVREIRKELRHMDRNFSVLNDHLMQIQVKYRDMDDRVYDLEKRSP
jgi:chromosome segregation ATPase